MEYMEKPFQMIYHYIMSWQVLLSNRLVWQMCKSQSESLEDQ